MLKINNKPKNWEKLQFYLKIRHIMNNITSEYSDYVDKLKAKTIVKLLCPQINVSKIIKILDTPDDIIEQDIESGHIIKSAHGSGWNINLRNITNIDNIKKQLFSYNKIYNDGKEKQYLSIKPKFFIEEIIDDKYRGANGDAFSYNFYCLYGKLQFLRIVDPLNKMVNSYDSNWNIIGENYMNMNFEKPSNYDDILNFITILSKQFEFVRIDLFIAKNDIIYFSEFTFTSNGGYPFGCYDIDNSFVDTWLLD